ncbi:hypothetical protein PR048_016295 [Dryococelus australis]|uniref:TGF-beta propeptide domain-containing protein n=1 Tax=Dryococelus australis TaxID=614101 RepID=A0ABQ9HKG9_9NEOP|nr:hypothetical protein PR048_016295 [Dryococelus australis]
MRQGKRWEYIGQTCGVLQSSQIERDACQHKSRNTLINMGQDKFNFYNFKFVELSFFPTQRCGILCHHAGTIHHGNGKMLWFDVSKVPSDEVLVTVELRLYKTVSNFKPWQSFNLVLYQFTPVSKG